MLYLDISSVWLDHAAVVWIVWKFCVDVEFWSSASNGPYVAQRSLLAALTQTRFGHTNCVWRLYAMAMSSVWLFVCLFVCRQKLSSLDLWYLLTTNTYAFQRTRSWSPRMILSNSKPWPHSPLMAYCVDPSGDTFDESVLL